MDAIVVERRARNASEATTHALPAETLSQIFYEVSRGRFLTYPSPYRVPDVDYKLPNKYPLLAVCSKWRQVAYSSPTFWQDAVVAFDSPKKLKRVADILKLHLSNSGRLPLRIRFENGIFNASEFHSKGLVHPSVNGELARNLYRIEMLELNHYPPSMFKKWLDSLSRLSGIDKLQVGTDVGDDLDLRNNRSLASLSVQCFKSRILVRPDNIQDVFLYSIPMDRCVRLLFECRNLKTFCMRNPREAVDDISFLQQALVLPCLTELRWSVAVGDELESRLFRYLAVPALEHFALETEDAHNFRLSDDEDTDDLQDFCERLPLSLRRLTINEYLTTDDKNVIKFFPKNLPVEHIELYCETEEWSEARDCASWLSGYYRGDDGGLAKAFPKLTHLRITGAEWYPSTQLEEVLPFFDALQERIEPGEVFKLGVSMTTFMFERDMLPPDILIMVDTGALEIVDDSGRRFHEPFETPLSII
ncbi:hypothetical protein NP233_g6719 [Leucocoprinus birnbaumii]|uniref:F-box domain-containing protein n=1 Tax=Leucocoprinus birnbaumii TaxID=56174 RepID=A0AAD5VRL2_9AGAR|nr:hypothetical protein NP233_g6719 [Leucocoprinus birnbaumii]